MCQHDSAIGSLHTGRNVWNYTSHALQALTAIAVNWTAARWVADEFDSRQLAMEQDSNTVDRG